MKLIKTVIPPKDSTISMIIVYPQYVGVYWKAGRVDMFELTELAPEATEEIEW